MNPLANKLARFAELTESDVSLVEAICTRRVRTFAANRDVIREGERVTFGYALCEGWSVRTKQIADGAVQIVGILLPGDWCGFDPGLQPIADHSIETATGCVFALVTADESDEFLSSPSLKAAVSQAQFAAQSMQREWTVNVGRRDALQAMAHLVCELHFRLQRCGLVDGLEFNIPLNQVRLADCLALSAVHVNRTLRELRQRSLMELSGQRLKIHDLDRLRSIADFNPRYLQGSLPEA